MDENQNPEQEIPSELAGKMNAWRKANPEATLTIIEEEVDAELAKAYDSDSAPRFINGLLGTLADHQEELRRERLRGTEAVTAEEQRRRDIWKEARESSF